MERVRFGTDGIRGRAGIDVTHDVAWSVGRAAAELMGDAGALLIAWDTRESSPGLAAAVGAGASGVGAEVHELGVVPTPVLAYLAAREGLPGCMVTASHNLHHDNGLKLFDHRGLKLPAELEGRIEDRVNELLSAGVERPAPPGAAESRPGRQRTDLVDHYLEELYGSVAVVDLRRLRIGLDFANGAGSALGPRLVERLGLGEAVLLGDEPDGRNINLSVGSTAPEALMAVVREKGLDAGFAFDGDGDRVLAIDERGELVDGDVLIAILATDLSGRGLLNGNTVVVSNWSNLGLDRAMSAHGIVVERTEIGDKYILDSLVTNGYSLGGEQSGHIILRDRNSTGDGLLVAAELLSMMSRSDRPLSQMAAEAMTRLPQVSTAVGVVSAPREVVDGLADDLAVEQAALAETGRAVLRPSGTEPVVRVMAEATTTGQAEAVVERLSARVRAHDGELSARRG